MKKQIGLSLYLMLGCTLLWGQPSTTPIPHDPTQPAVVDEVATDSTKKKEEEHYTLQSIIISPTRRIALINDKFLTVGDKIGEDTVEIIRKNAVVLSRPGQKRTLFLFDLERLE